MKKYFLERQTDFKAMQMTKGLLVAVCAQLLLYVGVHSVPLSTSEDNQLISEGAHHPEGVTTEDQDSQNFEEGEEPTPTEAYLKEIREQVEAPRTEEEEEPLERDTRSTCTYPGTYFTKLSSCMLFKMATCMLRACA